MFVVICLQERTLSRYRMAGWPKRESGVESRGCACSRGKTEREGTRRSSVQVTVDIPPKKE